MDTLSAPFHFAATFLVTVAALGGLWVTIYRPRFVPVGPTRRLLFGLGWLLLALGELLHGSQIVAPEHDPVATTLRVLGYTAVVAGLQSLITGKQREPEAIVSGPGRLPGSSGHIVTRAPVVPQVRRLIVALGLLALTETAFLTIPNLNPQESGAAWFGVHALRLAGGLAILAWLGQVVRSSIQARVVAVFIGLMLVIVIAISGSLTQVFIANLTDESLSRARRESEVQARRVQDQVQLSESQARQIARLTSFREALAERSVSLGAVISGLQEPGGAFDSSDFMALLDPSGALLAISAAGQGGSANLEVEDALALVGTSVVQDALDRQLEGGGFDRLGTGRIAAIAAVPVLHPDGVEVAGVVVMGSLIDETYLAEQREARGGQAFLITRTEVLAGTTDQSEGVLPDDPRALETLFGRGARIAVNNTVGGQDVFSAYVPLQRDGEVIASLVFSAPSGVLGLAQSNVATPLFFIALWATAMGGGLSLLFGSRLTQPIRDLTTAADRVREGDLSARVSLGSADEVGVLGDTFDEMTEALQSLTQDLRQTAEEQLELRRRLETILQSMTDGVVAVNNNGTVEAFNREAERILEVPQSSAVGSNVKDVIRIFDAAGAPVVPAIFDLASGSVSGIVVTQDRTSRPVVVTSAPVQDDNNEALGGVAVLRDLTREVEIEKMKTEFLANISHELRTPITPIKGYSDLLRRKEVPREQTVHFAEEISASAQRLERIVEMLVDFSAMEAGRLSPQKVSVDFGQVVDEIVQKWSHSAPKHSFDRHGFEELPKVYVDRRLVPLAINELVDNAVKFSPDGGKVLLSAQHVNLGRGRGEVRISVTDEGIGIGQEQLSRIGGNFIQADASETRAYGGLGLGLAYVRRIAESHGGHLEVDSRPDRGSCFTLVLPAKAPPAPKVRQVFGGSS
ncbi:MAG: ATP-binding protein [Actinomycetota bacterium]